MEDLQVWMLDDGTPGHWSMTEGLVNLFAKTRKVRPRRIPLRWRWGPARQVLQRLAASGAPIPPRLLHAAVRIELPDSRPGLIVSRGGATLLPNACLAREYGTPNIFIGTLRGMPESAFSAVVLQREELNHDPYFPLPAAPTRIDPATLAEAAHDFAWSHGPPDTPAACLLLGGNGSGFSYRTGDWTNIARGVAALHTSAGIRWCVASSRRTPPHAEEILRREIPAAALHETCWWHRGDRRSCLAPFLGASRQAYCTVESMSMLEECVNAGIPVQALSPDGGSPAKAFGAFLSRREREGRLAITPIPKFAAGHSTAPPGGWKPLPPGAMADQAAALLRKLGLLP